MKRFGLRLQSGLLGNLVKNFFQLSKCSLLGRKSNIATLRSQIEGYTRFLFSGNFPAYPLLFEPPRLSISKKISSLPVFSPKQMEKFTPFPLLLEPPR